VAEGRFAIVFEYRVEPERTAEFERAYGSDGVWAAFFGHDPAYRGTQLWAFAERPGRYLLVDRWDSAEAYRGFLDRHRAEYDRRGAETASLYTSERVIGEHARR
jgi:heme-degrading monooxygenase HmoA